MLLSNLLMPVIWALQKISWVVQYGFFYFILVEVNPPEYVWAMFWALLGIDIFTKISLFLIVRQEGE